jgi:coenzyme Q-binding protein COQ10
VPTHAERRFLPYTPEQLFDLVAAIDRYPEFLPWCLAARIRTRTDDVLVGDLVIGFKMVREKFTSRVTLDRPRRIHVVYTEGPLRHLNNHWLFEPHPPDGEHPNGGTMLDFHIDFEFHSRLLQSLMGVLFNEAVKRMVHAFDARARQLYGAPLSVRASLERA